VIPDVLDGGVGGFGEFGGRGRVVVQRREDVAGRLGLEGREQVLCVVAVHADDFRFAPVSGRWVGTGGQEVGHTDFLRVAEL
jgi:hypothetical protein